MEQELTTVTQEAFNSPGHFTFISPRESIPGIDEGFSL